MSPLLLGPKIIGSQLYCQNDFANHLAGSFLILSDGRKCGLSTAPATLPQGLLLVGELYKGQASVVENVVEKELFTSTRQGVPARSSNRLSYNTNMVTPSSLEH